MTNLTRRIEQLEGAVSIHDAPTCVIVTSYPEEPSDVAVARYRAEHPDVPEDTQFIVFVTGFRRAPGSCGGAELQRQKSRR